MQNKIHRIALPLFIALGLTLAYGAGATKLAWSAPRDAELSDPGNLEKPGVVVFEGDPDVPNGSVQKRIGISGPSDGTRPTSRPWTWYGHQRVLLRVYLSRWFGL